MSFSDPVKIIDHIPKDFNMKVNKRHRGQVKPAPKIKAQPAKAPEPSSFEPPCEQQSGVWKAVAFISALAVVFGALITGAWE